MTETRKGITDTLPLRKGRTVSNASSRSTSARLPSYRIQKQGRGKPARAFVTLNGQRHYLGQAGSPQSHREYDRVIKEWLANGRRLVVSPHQVTIVELIAAFWIHAKSYYRKPDGSETSTLHRFSMALHPLKEMYELKKAADFNPICLKAVRQHMIEANWSRGVINDSIMLIRSVFRWGVENGLVSSETLATLRAVAPLKRGRSSAKESRKVRPVPLASVDAVTPFVSRQVRAMIQLQLLTAARAGELVKLRPIDIDMSDNPWAYKPEDHKTAHRGRDRTIYFGQQAQAILAEFLTDRAVDAFMFSPREAELERRAKMHANRKTPPQQGNRPGTNRVREPKREPADHYDVASYRRAIQRACDMAFPAPDHLRAGENESRRAHMARLTPDQKAELQRWRHAHRWHPHQLRHNSGTFLKKKFGLDTAKTILGHTSPSVTAIYAEIDDEKARAVISEVG